MEVDGITVSFGGLTALDRVSLVIPSGRIVGLIGPNGAGKTTLFDVVCGLRRPRAGRVIVHGKDVTRWPPYRRARVGIARTFQRRALFGSLTVIENLIVAADFSVRPGRLFSDALELPRGKEQRSSVERSAYDQLERLNLGSYSATLAREIPVGVARSVELARALMTNPRVLLLDEPNSGLRASESTVLSGALSKLNTEQDLTIVLVEHHMDFVLSLCQLVYVLDFGRLLESGSPGEIRLSPAVRSAYLGEEPDAGDAAS